jgi:hypothetical protein
MFREHVYWWLHYLRVFALNTPFAPGVKFTIGVSAYDGERLARMFGLEPKDVVDSYGLPCKQIEVEAYLIAFKWRVPADDPSRCGGPSTWGGIPPDVAKIQPRNRQAVIPFD